MVDFGIDAFKGPEGTIYENEKELDRDFRIEIDFTRMTLIKTLKESEASIIFHVDYHGEPRVLKVVRTLTDYSSTADPVSFISMRIPGMPRTACEI